MNPIAKLAKPPGPGFPFHSRGGFSLVETTMAMGITAFSMMALLAMLPVGMGIARDSAASTNNAMLFENVVSQLRVAAVSSTSSQIGVSGSDLYSLPPLDKTPGETTFTVNDAGQYLTDGASMAGGAYKIVDIKVFDPCAEPVNGIDPDPVSLASGGQVAYVHINIRNAHSMVSGTGSNTAVSGATTAVAEPSDFWTEIDIAEE